MPEEVNRVLADHSSDVLFAPTEKSRIILLGEGLSKEKIFVTGNTVVDSVFQNLELAKEMPGSTFLDCLELENGNYGVVTVHRQENVDDYKRFGGILEGLDCVVEETGFDLIYPIHPRAKKRLQQFSLMTKNVLFVEPLNYLSFLMLMSDSRIVLTDSGGVQEEACILGVPCVTMRDNTERPETLEVGSNVLAGVDPRNIVEKTRVMMKKSETWMNPFGDGNSGHKIVDILRCKFE
jgi:UDP-N-acetylglucosamine 2-epimerase (non-hydrolysing)